MQPPTDSCILKHRFKCLFEGHTVVASLLLTSKPDDAWKAFDEAAREIDRQKDALLDEISQRLQQESAQATLFTIRWQLA